MESNPFAAASPLSPKALQNRKTSYGRKAQRISTNTVVSSSPLFAFEHRLSTNADGASLVPLKVSN